MVHQTAANAYETYWGDRMTGAKTLLSYITDLLNTPVHKMSITFSYKTKYPQNAADWVLSRQNSVDTLILEGKYCDEKDVHHVLDKFRVTNTLYLGVSTSGSFQRSITAQLNRIQLVNTPWLTIDHLLDMNSSVIVIDKTRFTNRDMNRFLKCWVNGGHPRLRRLSLEMEPIRLEVLTEGLDMTVVRRETHKRYIVNERETVTIGDSWDIRRDRTASILDYEMEFGLRKLFSLVVWPDSKGNRYDL
uniref:FBA_2 domain-containing protein n=1 Tax=Caenorhabditis tropicalis TaxID=1561998 RepID=A0A1I7V216_9PELO